MLTKLEERGREKSAKYWPGRVGERVQFGEFELTLEREKKKRNVEKRVLLMKRISSQKKPNEQHQLSSSNHQKCRKIIHIQYVGWPDHGVPANKKEVCDLIKEVMEMKRIKKNGGPLVVHCSAGVGRTGAFVSLFHLYERLLFSQPSDASSATKSTFNSEPYEMDLEADEVFEVVANLRRQRDCMVQTLEQYEFIVRTYQLLWRKTFSSDASSNSSDSPPALSFSFCSSPSRPASVAVRSISSNLTPQLRSSERTTGTSPTISPQNCLRKSTDIFSPTSTLSSSSSPSAFSAQFLPLSASFSSPALYDSLCFSGSLSSSCGQEIGVTGSDQQYGHGLVTSRG